MSRRVAILIVAAAIGSAGCSRSRAQRGDLGGVGSGAGDGGIVGDGGIGDSGSGLPTGDGSTGIAVNSLTTKILPNGEPDLLNLGRYDFPATVVAGAVPLIGDINGDGRSDLIQVLAGSTTMTACTAANSGWICSTSPAQIPAGARAAVGDFNGDKLADVALLTDSSLSRCLSVAGGGWSCSTPTATVIPGAQLLVGDFDGDGNSDVAQFGGATPLVVCLSTGAGSAWSCASEGLQLLPNAIPLVADVDGDGKDDIVQYSPGTIALCPEAAGFACTAAAASLPGTTAPLLGDVDGDGKPELIGAVSAQQIGVCTLGAGVSCALAPLTMPAGSAPPSGMPALADVNNDGRADLLFATPGATALALCLGRADGSYACTAAQVSTMPGAGGMPGQPGASRITPKDVSLLMLVADFNGDGRDDLVYFGANGVISVLVTAAASLGVNLLAGDDDDCCTAKTTPGCNEDPNDGLDGGVVTGICGLVPSCCATAWNSDCILSIRAFQNCRYVSACGDGACDAGENNFTCPDDCAPDACGDGICGPTENIATCAMDCDATACKCDPRSGCVQASLVANKDGSWTQSIAAVANCSDDYGNMCQTQICEAVPGEVHSVETNQTVSLTTPGLTDQDCVDGSCTEYVRMGGQTPIVDGGEIRDGGVFENPDGCDVPICDALLNMQLCITSNTCVVAWGCVPPYYDAGGGCCSLIEFPDVCEPMQSTFLQNCPGGH